VAKRVGIESGRTSAKLVAPPLAEPVIATQVADAKKPLGGARAKKPALPVLQAGVVPGALDQVSKGQGCAAFPAGHGQANVSKPSAAERQSLVDLRAQITSNEGKYTYNAGKIDILPDGRVSFVDLTMEQVPLAMVMTTDDAQRARLSEFRVDWPGGKDPLQVEGSYVKLAKSGELKERIAKLKQIRDEDKIGAYKRAGVKSLKIGGYNLNVGEEKALSGTQGTGTVYFSGCSMGCNFCQYNDISQLKGGADTKVKELANILLDLQDRGAHNIDLMTPSHLMPEILEAVDQAAKKGLTIPLAYNTGGFEDLDALKQLDGIIDIYIPDAKFGSDEAGKRYGRVEGYFDNNHAAIAEMFRQVGKLDLDERGVARKGVLVRHLVMPNDVAKAEEIAKSLASISTDLHVNLMEQWTPGHLTFQTPEVHRPITHEEFEAAVAAFRKHGFQIEDTHAETGV
jgi:putative pyruvate formate lyase activating enzyme